MSASASLPLEPLLPEPAVRDIELMPRPLLLGVLVGLVDEDWMILLHIVPVSMPFVQCSVFSDSALGEDTST